MSDRPWAFRWTTVVAFSLVLHLGVVAPTAAQESGGPGRKSPPLALALSVLLPGAGQVYNGQHLKGAVMFGAAVITAGPIILTASDVLGLDDDESGTGVHILGAVGVGVILWSWIDAPLSAKAINRQSRDGRMALEIGPRVEIPRSGSGIDLTFLRIGL